MKRRINLIAVMVLFTIFSQAQQKTVSKASSGFGIRAGVNFQNITGKDQNGDKLNNDILTGFNAGITYDIPVGTDFYFQPGLLYTQKGAKSTDEILNQNVSSTIKLSYVELPLNFIYKPLLGTGHMLLGFGPYVALGVGGKASFESNGISNSENIKFQNTVKITDPDNVFYVRPVDAGANLLIGYEFSNKVSFQLNAQLGLLKINPEYEGSANDQTSAMNTGFGFSIGYKF
jgi:Outer membrane protein beta-barrel domain